MLGYTKNADSIDSNSPKCFARENEGKVKQYFIRIDRKGTLIDPMDVYVTTETKFRGSGIERYPFIQVSETTWKHFMNFLKTSNKAHLVQANRSLRG